MSSAWLVILFGVGVLQVLTTAPAGLADQFPKDCPPRPLLAARPQDAARECHVIEIESLTVRYGGVTSLDALTLVFARGTCGLIGPNGAGKTTFFNVLTGFVRPASGTVNAFGTNLLAMSHFRRARWGVRRTFQTEQAIEELSVYDNVAMVRALPAARPRAAPTCSPRSSTSASTPRRAPGGHPRRPPAPAGGGRAGRGGKPRLVLLDEPAAGLPDQETGISARSSAAYPSTQAR